MNSNRGFQGFLRTLGLFAMLVSSGCGGSGSEQPQDSSAAAEVDPGPSLPALMDECANCHALADLGQAPAGKPMGWREWTLEHGTGLIRQDPAFPDPVTHFVLPWPERGFHDEDELQEDRCLDCHPVDSWGIGHGGETCAGSCHSWLPAMITTRGPVPAQGQPVEYKGSMRPETLLEAVEGAHQQLWKGGLRPENLPMKIASFNLGCGGCHNVSSESHGHVPACTQCHKICGPDGQEIRDRMLEAIAARRKELDPEHSEMSACGYCHPQGDPYQQVGQAACYNCHLSGHQPVDKEGQPHFWPALDLVQPR